MWRFVTTGVDLPHVSPGKKANETIIDVPNSTKILSVEYHKKSKSILFRTMYDLSVSGWELRSIFVYPENAPIQEPIETLKFIGCIYYKPEKKVLYFFEQIQDPKQEEEKK